jgi:hypothetical protein
MAGAPRLIVRTPPYGNENEKPAHPRDRGRGVLLASCPYRDRGARTPHLIPLRGGSGGRKQGNLRRGRKGPDEGALARRRLRRRPLVERAADNLAG